MFVKFARAYFSKAGTLYPARQVVEVPDDEFLYDKKEKLPSGAVKITDKKASELVEVPAPPVPGFGAKTVKQQEQADLGLEPTGLSAEVTAVAPGTEPEPPVVPKEAKVATAPRVPSAKDDKSSKDPAKDL